MNIEEIKSTLLAQASSFEQDVQKEVGRLLNDSFFPNDMFRIKLGGGNYVQQNVTPNIPSNNSNPSIASAAPSAPINQQTPPAQMSMAEKILALRGASCSGFHKKQ